METILSAPNVPEPVLRPEQSPLPAEASLSRRWRRVSQWTPPPIRRVVSHNPSVPNL